MTLLNPRFMITIAALLAAIVLLCMAHLRFGVFETTLFDVWQILWDDDGSNAAFSLKEIRLPRALNALCVGAGLALSGALIQIITRNPLGDPGLTGVSGGAAFGVALVITYLSHAVWQVLLGGLVGGFFAASITAILARGAGYQDMKVILAGISVSIFFIAATSALMILNRSSMQSLYYWMIGGFANKGWAELSYLWLWVAIAGVLSILVAPTLELLLLDDSVAQGVGFNSGLWRLLAGTLSVVLAAVCVSVAGPIGFIGFVAPHIARLLASYDLDLRSNLKAHLLLSGLIGGTLTLTADLAARLLPLGNRAPAGVLVTVFGGILFLILTSPRFRRVMS